MKKIPTTVDRKAWKKWLLCPVLALLLVLTSLPVYAGEQKTEVTETPTVTQETGSESAAESAALGINDEIIADELESVDLQEVAVTSNSNWRTTKPHEGEVLQGGYVGFKNKASGKYLTVPNGTANVCQQSTTYNMVYSQEFHIQYYYNADFDLAYFTIFPLSSSGTIEISMRIKANDVTNGLANVAVQLTSMPPSNERWQIEHVTGTYYCIYLADNPDSASVKYALTSNNNSNSTNSAIGSLDNVYVSAYTGDDSQLWQICADSMPMDINGYDITQGGSQETVLGTMVSYYYIPKSYNMVLLWSVSPSGMATSYGGGHFIPQKYGEMTVKLQYSSNGIVPIVKSAALFSIPETGEYYISNSSTNRYMDIEGPSKQNNAVIQQWDFHTGDYEKWRITNDSTTVGYVRIRSLYSKKYLAGDSNGTGVIKQTLTLDNYSLWKIETTSHGNIKLTCKAFESNGYVLSVPSSANNNGTNLTVAPYTNNDDNRDEWILYQFDGTLEVEHYYDQGFAIRYAEFNTDPEALIEEYQEFVAERYLHEFGLEIVPTYSLIISSADSCKGTVTSSNLSSSCIHDTNGGCLNRANLYNDVNPGSRTKSVVLWTGHILYNNVGSAMQTNGSFRMVITPSQVVLSNQGYINQSEEHTYVNYIFSLMHELAHSMGTDDHYCTLQSGQVICGNETCDKCVYHYDEVRICLMGIRQNVAELIVENTFCSTCKDIITDHIRDHH